MGAPIVEMVVSPLVVLVRLLGVGDQIREVHLVVCLWVVVVELQAVAEEEPPSGP